MGSIGCARVCKDLPQADCAKNDGQAVKCMWMAKVDAVAHVDPTCKKNACPSLTGVESSDLGTCTTAGCAYTAAVTTDSLEADATCVDDAKKTCSTTVASLCEAGDKAKYCSLIGGVDGVEARAGYCMDAKQ
ncbi:MAG: hypothetical protein O2897_05080 [bacterium]|nr:hypothetical protein [bacterium]